MISDWRVLHFAIAIAKSEIRNPVADDYDWRLWTVNVVRGHGSRRQARLAGRAYDRTISHAVARSQQDT